MQLCLESGWNCALCDPLAAAIAAEPSLTVPWHNAQPSPASLHYCAVQRGEGPAYAQTVVDRDSLSKRHANTWVVHAVDKAAVKASLHRAVEG